MYAGAGKSGQERNGRGNVRGFENGILWFYLIFRKSVRQKKTIWKSYKYLLDMQWFILYVVHENKLRI